MERSGPLGEESLPKVKNSCLTSWVDAEVFSFIQDIALSIRDIDGKFAAANRAFLQLMEVD